MDERLDLIRRAYDEAARKYRDGVDPLEAVPAEFRESAAFREFFREAALGHSHSNALADREFLDPRAGMRFLDGGCSANLAAYGFDRWPCLYYGVDVSAEVIGAMRSFAARERIVVGALEVAELRALPFGAGFFDLASVVGVLAYFDLDYVERALLELRRVLKHGARLVVDIANPDHPRVDTMFEFEAYLGMPLVAKSRSEFEGALGGKFRIKAVDDSRVMLKYFVAAGP